MSPMNSDDTITLRRTDAEVRAEDFDHAAWRHAPAVPLTLYWSGAPAPPARNAEARLLWTPAALCVRFRCQQFEPLVVSHAPQTETKTVGLWERDVCEIFVAPDAEKPERYFEFEVAPTGEWLDLEIEWQPDERRTNWEYESGMRAAGRVRAGEVWTALTMPWSAFGREEPQAGDLWRVNLFRCVGRDTHDSERGYLAWQPTHTVPASFHLPAAFGWLAFGRDGERDDSEVRTVSPPNWERGRLVR